MSAMGIYFIGFNRWELIGIITDFGYASILVTVAVFYVLASLE